VEAEEVAVAEEMEDGEEVEDVEEVEEEGDERPLVRQSLLWYATWQEGKFRHQKLQQSASIGGFHFLNDFLNACT
jgi:hypothetical protein